MTNKNNIYKHSKKTEILNVSESLNDKEIIESGRLVATYYGKGSEAIKLVNPKKIEVDTIEKKAILQSKSSLELFIEQYESPADKVGVRADKLLKFALLDFTKNNKADRDKYGNSKVDLNSINYFAKVNIEKFAKALGKDIEVKTHDEKGNPLNRVEIEKEEKRVKSLIDKVRRDVQKDRKILARTSVFFEEKINGKIEDMELKYVGSSRYNNGTATIVIDPLFALYLLNRNTLIYQDKQIYKINNDNAYRMYSEMHKHYSKVANFNNGTNDRLKVKTLLSYTTLKTIEDVRENNGSRRREIKDYFENIIQYLVDNKYIIVPTEEIDGEIIESYYGLPNGHVLSNEERKEDFAIEKMSYEEWSNLNVYFKPATARELDKILKETSKTYIARKQKRKSIASKK